MLRSLYIKNYALINELRVEFEPGLSIITGETGAGKSIILTAFSLLLGEKPPPDVVREGQSKAIVEAVFDTTHHGELQAYLSTQEIDAESDGTLLIRREVSAKGTNRAFVNDSPAPITVLQELGNLLVDLHGQHQHQSLLRKETHIQFLDECAHDRDVLEAYRVARGELSQCHSIVQGLERELAQSKERLERNASQLQEIQTLAPKVNEDEEIDHELRILENAESLRDNANSVLNALYRGASSAYEQLSATSETLAAMNKFDARAAEWLAEVNSARTIVTELEHDIAAYAHRIDWDESRLESLRTRAANLQRLKKKFGGTLNAVLELRTQLEQEEDSNSTLLDRLAAARASEQDARRKLASHAANLHALRKKTATKLQPQVAEALAPLGIEHAKFEVQINTLDAPSSDAFAVELDGEVFHAGPSGIDAVEFFISTNPGIAPRPLARVASGGEISRIMLALKSLLAKQSQLPLLIFDEIDVGISGRVAQQVGRAMHGLAANHQVIAITHLPQIAASADTHFVVEKSVDANVTTSTLRKLSTEEHSAEVARLLSGDSITDGALENARTLIAEVSQTQPGRKRPVTKQTVAKTK